MSTHKLTHDHITMKNNTTFKRKSKKLKLKTKRKDKKKELFLVFVYFIKNISQRNTNYSNKI